MSNWLIDWLIDYFRPFLGSRHRVGCHSRSPKLFERIRCRGTADLLTQRRPYRPFLYPARGGRSWYRTSDSGGPTIMVRPPTAAFSVRIAERDRIFIYIWFFVVICFVVPIVYQYWISWLPRNLKFLYFYMKSLWERFRVSMIRRTFEARM